jgi:hypothetical protein
MIEIKEDFIAILEDLNDRINEPIKYNNKKASGLLRQLLLDSNPLLHQINREFKKIIVFKSRKLVKAEVGIGNIIMEGIVPMKNEHFENHENLDLKSFLEKRCLIYNKQLYTVHDIIKINANMRGGIHSGIPKSNKETQAIEMIKKGPLVGFKNGTPLDMTLALIHPISKIVLSALKELKNDVEKSLLN